MCKFRTFFRDIFLNVFLEVEASFVKRVLQNTVLALYL